MQASSNDMRAVSVICDKIPSDNRQLSQICLNSVEAPYIRLHS